MSRRELAKIVRITAKKKHPNLVTVVYEADDAPSTPAIPRTPSAGGSTPSGPATPVSGKRDASLLASTPQTPSTPETASASPAGTDTSQRDQPAETGGGAAATAAGISRSGSKAVTGAGGPEEDGAGAEGTGPVLTERYVVPEAEAAKKALRELITTVREEKAL